MPLLRADRFAHLGDGCSQRLMPLWMVCRDRIVDPAHSRMPFKELRNPQRVLAMAFHTQRQRLQALQEEPGIERRDGWSKVTQQLHTGLDNVGQWSKRLNV